jgi:signal transduction histidine kinase
MKVSTFFLTVSANTPLNLSDDVTWPAALVDAVLGGTAEESRSHGRAAIPRILEIVAQRCRAFGAALWRRRTSDPNQIAIMGSWFRGTEDWLILKEMTLEETCSGRAVLQGHETENNLPRNGRHRDHPFLVKHRLHCAQSVKVDLPGQWVGSLTVYRQEGEPDFGDDDLVRLQAVARMVPGLFRAALHQAELTLRREIGEIIRKHDDDDNATGKEREEARKATIRECCNAIQRGFSSLEVSVYLGDFETDGDPQSFICFYTNEGPHSELAKVKEYRTDSKGYSALVLTGADAIHVRDTTDEKEEAEFERAFPTFRRHTPQGIRKSVQRKLLDYLPDRKPPLPPLSLIVSRIEYHEVILGLIRCWVTMKHGPKSYEDEDAQLLGLISQSMARMIFDWRTADHRRRAMKGAVGKSRSRPDSFGRMRSEEHRFFVEALAEIDAVVPDASISSVSLRRPDAEELEIVACSGNLTDDEWNEALRQRYPVGTGDEGRSLASQVYLSGEEIIAKADTPRYRKLFDGVRQIIVVPLSTGESDRLGVLELRNRSARDFPQFALSFAESFGRILGLRYAWFLAQRKQIERESEFNRAFSDASHQIKGPLAAAWKRLDQLLTDNPSVIRAGELHAIRGMLRRTEFASKLVRLFGDIAAGRKLQIAGRPISPAELVGMIGSLCTDAQTIAHPSREIRVEFEHDSIYKHAPPNLRADKELLSQAMWNLLDNGVKYSSVKTVVQVYGGRTQTGRFYLAVTNRGATILPHEVALSKQRHWRKPEVIPYVGEGNGLGLYIVDEIMRAHGAALDILPTRRTDGITEVRLSFDPKLD